MSTLYDVEVTKYLCTCGNWLPLCRLYFCKYCLVLRCAACATSEVDSMFCPSCLENMTSGEARTHKNRCNGCYECPCCDQLLSLRVIQTPPLNSADVTQNKPETKESSGEKLYRLYCQYCCWSSQEAGLPDQTSATRAWPEPAVDNAKSLNSAMEHFSHLAAIEKLETARKNFIPKRLSLFQYHPERFAFHNILLKRQTGKADGEKDSDDSTKLASISSEEVEPLDETIFSRQVNVANLTTMSQRLKIPETQPQYVSDLLPLRKPLVVRKSVRCRSCEHNVIRGEYVPSSVKFKIQFCAMLLVPEVRLLRRPLMDDDQFPVFLTVTNFGMTTMTILLLPDAEHDGDDQLSVVFPSEEISIGKHDEPSIYTKRGPKADPLELFKDDSQFVAQMSDHKVIVRLKVTRKKRLPNTELHILVKHHCENTLLQPVGESKCPEMLLDDSKLFNRRKNGYVKVLKHLQSNELGRCGKRFEFPILCQTCLGKNPYMRMMKEKYGGECKICSRPFTTFRWCPGKGMRYKKTEVCQTCSKLKNVCQTCLLDLEYGLPVQVRDYALGLKDDLPKTGANKDYFIQAAEREMAKGDGVSSAGSLAKYVESGPNEMLMRLARSHPYYNRNRPHICSFWVKGECKRGEECPYRHEMPSDPDDPLSVQNIRDRYYGSKDPVADKLLNRAKAFPVLKPPEDRNITTVYVGNLGEEGEITEKDIRHHFYQYGEIRSVVMLPSKGCAFVQFTSREAAEVACDKTFGKLIVKGRRLTIRWGRPQGSMSSQQTETGTPEYDPVPGLPAALPIVDFFGLQSASEPIQPKRPRLDEVASSSSMLYNAPSALYPGADGSITSRVVPPLSVRINPQVTARDQEMIDSRYRIHYPSQDPQHLGARDLCD
ncbi:hypothetical protein M513_04718 [Trichuris suis]|uniref:Pre-mRNA-splicing factor RBM22 n=1 Tax=Trichuris suis TaxID=68888 RepID=A0A085MAX9_9BILA|nr:hypothetical protein M513_04718 [Trichuris suis]